MLERLKRGFAPARPPETSPQSFRPEYFSRLERVRIRFGRAHGMRAGETPVRGRSQESGIEVESFQGYAPGDDIRHVDWNAVARLDQLLTRRFVAEREIPVHLLLDVSASMGTPERDGKLRFGAEITAALAWIALNNSEPVRIGAFRGGSGGVELLETPLLRHHGRFPHVPPFLAGLTARGRTGLAGGVDAYLERHRERGMAFVVSDFLVPDDDREQALTRLRRRRIDVWAVHVVGRQERDLEGLWGRFELHDVETGGTREVVLSERDRRRYREAFEAGVERLRDFCHRGGIGHVVAASERGAERCLTRDFARAGMLRMR